MIGLSLAIVAGLLTAYVVGYFEGRRMGQGIERMQAQGRAVRNFDRYADSRGLVGGITPETLADIASSQEEGGTDG